MNRVETSRETPGTRESILRAALTAFTAQGYEGASTRNIAARAGVNHGLIPYYFGTKEKLWQEAVDLAFGEMQAGIEAVLGDPALTDDRARAARLIRAHVHFVAERPEFVRLMYEEGKRRGPRMRWLVDRHVRPLYESIAELFARLHRKAGGAPPIPPVHLFYALAGASGLIFHQAEECRRVSGSDPFDDAMVDRHAEVVERMILGVV